MFFVPETKGVPIEEMDKLFGGNQGQEDLRRMMSVRVRLGITGEDVNMTKAKEIDEDHGTVEEKE